MKYFIMLFFTALLFASCQETISKYDATGTFESTEIIVSAEASGKILSFNIEEGADLKKGQVVAKIDASSLELQKEQVEATISAVGKKQGDSKPQIAVLKQQLKSAEASLNTLRTQMKILQKEQARVERMFSAEAATQKQVDDIGGQVDILQNRISAAKSQKQVLHSQISSAKKTVDIKNRAVTSEKEPLRKKAEQIADQMNRANVINPIKGTVLSKYANKGELISIGRPLYKLADLSKMVLRAYISGSQLGQINRGQMVSVYIDDGVDDYKKYKGKITWISPKAEFTPKTIQTKDERANLVYAIKIAVKNDGYLKIGMYGEVDFENGITEKK